MDEKWLTFILATGALSGLVAAVVTGLFGLLLQARRSKADKTGAVHQNKIEEYKRYVHALDEMTDAVMGEFDEFSAEMKEITQGLFSIALSADAGSPEQERANAVLLNRLFVCLSDFNARTFRRYSKAKAGLHGLKVFCSKPLLEELTLLEADFDALLAESAAWHADLATRFKQGLGAPAASKTMTEIGARLEKRKNSVILHMRKDLGVD